MIVRCLTGSHCGRPMTWCVLGQQCSPSSRITSRRVWCRFVRRALLNDRWSVLHRHANHTSTSSTGSGCRTVSVPSRIKLTILSHIAVAKSPIYLRLFHTFHRFTQCSLLCYINQRSLHRNVTLNTRPITYYYPHFSRIVSFRLSTMHT